ncbi:MAG TPA: ABC transporter ATP-binding protein [Defluviitaleaceae bacterium]|jgi:putative ABC transport system ATP-binding protein|nr:ABC transporter ATP-binding protein [Candidatus Epulonipiscium sp.]HPT75213.1 ABC transporter ATP-binding protein [Defluviitaleaceae bacterium]HQD50799.1 ABC transporter ATP-binding protein [Defluviitaleaceae bacterium]
MEAILKAEKIEKIFKQEKILKGISLEIMPNSFTVLLGPSGSGKTTLLNILSGLLKPSSGKVYYKDKAITEFSKNQLADWKRKNVSNIFQSYLLLNNLTVRENIEIGMFSPDNGLPLDELSHLLEIHHLLDKFPSELSGGQQQRVAIARAVIKKPDILFCDEATGALDENNSKKVVALLHHLKQSLGLTVIFVTHNLQIAETADRVITIKDGLIHQDKINQNPISAYEMIWG